MPSAMSSPADGSGGQTEERSSTIWSILPTFDPSTDDPKEYVDKVRFLHSICPQRDRPMLAPRLAMLMKGTAWAQIKSADTAKLADPEHGIQVLLKAVATWEEAAELQTYDKFEKAIYKIIQKGDETNMSFVNRLNVAFMELGDVNLKDMKAFILLRQSSLTSDDKRKVIVMTNGKLESDKIEAAMRTLNTKILGSQSTGESKRKVYPVCPIMSVLFPFFPYYFRLISLLFPYYFSLVSLSLLFPLLFIVSVLFSYDFLHSLLFPYYFPIFPYYFRLIFPLLSLLYPYYLPIISLLCSYDFYFPYNYVPIIHYYVRLISLFFPYHFPVVSLFFPYYVPFVFPICSLLPPYCFPIFPYCFPVFPYCFPN